MNEPTELARFLAIRVAMFVVVCAVSAAVTGEDGLDPWQLLETLRGNLAASSQQARFVQEYQPAGFSRGDSESGDLYLAIPECVRWDYLEPYPKSFLLCDTVIHTWNPGDRAGRRFTFTDSDEPGLDLLRLRLDELQQRYEARLEGNQQQSLVVVLSPRTQDYAIAEASLTIDLSAKQLLGLSFSDQEGNVSRFTIAGYQPLAVKGIFEPPSGLEWMEE